MVRPTGWLDSLALHTERAATSVAEGDESRPRGAAGECGEEDGYGRASAASDRRGWARLREGCRAGRPLRGALSRAEAPGDLPAVSDARRLAAGADGAPLGGLDHARRLEGVSGRRWPRPVGALSHRGPGRGADPEAGVGGGRLSRLQQLAVSHLRAGRPALSRRGAAAGARAERR